MRIDRRAVIVAVVTALALAPWYIDFSWLIGIGLFAFGLTNGSTGQYSELCCWICLKNPNSR